MDEELDRLVESGVLDPVQYAEWAAPIMVAWKPDRKSIRLCEDFKQTINWASKLDCYPIPKIEDLLVTLKGGKFFSKLDLDQAYQQIVAGSRVTKVCGDKYTERIVQTHSVAVRNRISSEHFSTGHGVNFAWYPGSHCVCGQHPNLREFRARKCGKAAGSALLVVGSRSEVEECVLLITAVEYLGFKVDAEGLHPLY